MTNRVIYLGRPAAMFYDLENVIGGYGAGFVSRVGDLSLTALEAQILDSCERELGAFAVKRAYADWSKTGLKVLRKALVEEGIEPRQVFGFGDGGKTNAADIELVIDVLELVYQRPEVTTYVIVSGDGGFGSLVRKLHEFGKYVVVAGYPERSGRALRSVCDLFVTLQRTDDVTRPSDVDTGAVTSNNANPSAIASLRRVVAGLAFDRVHEPSDIVELVAAFFAAVDNDEVCRKIFETEGYLLAALAQILYPYLDAEVVRSKFGGFANLVSEAVETSDVFVERGQSGSPGRVGRRTKTIESQEVVQKPSPRPEYLTAAVRVLEDAANTDPKILPDVLRPIVERVASEEPNSCISVSDLLKKAGSARLREVIKDYYGSASRLLRLTLRDSEFGVAQLRTNLSITQVQPRSEVDLTLFDLLEDLEPPSDYELALQKLKRNRINLPPDFADAVDVMLALEALPYQDGETTSGLIARLIEAEVLSEAVGLSAIRSTLSALMVCGAIEGPNGVPDWLDQPCRQTVFAAAEMKSALSSKIVELLEEDGLNTAGVTERILFIEDRR